MQAKEYMYREGKEEPNLYPVGNLAHTYELMGEYALAAETYKQLIDDFDETSLMTIKDLSANYARSGQLEKAFEVIETYWNGGQVEKKQYLYYRALLYAGKWKEARNHIKKYGEIITDRVDTDYRACRMSDYRHMWAWFHLMNGRCEDGLHALNEAIANSKKMTELKSVTDLMSNKLFFLTICKQVRDNGNCLPSPLMLSDLLLLLFHTMQSKILNISHNGPYRKRILSEWHLLAVPS